MHRSANDPSLLSHLERRSTQRKKKYEDYLEIHSWAILIIIRGVGKATCVLPPARNGGVGGGAEGSTLTTGYSVY